MSVRFVVPVRVSSLVARCELCPRTLPGSVLAIGFDEPWLPPAVALFPCVPEAPMLPAAADPPPGWPWLRPCAAAGIARIQAAAATNVMFTIMRFMYCLLKGTTPNYYVIYKNYKPGWRKIARMFTAMPKETVLRS